MGFAGEEETNPNEAASLRTSRVLFICCSAGSALGCLGVKTDVFAVGGL